MNRAFTARYRGLVIGIRGRSRRNRSRGDQAHGRPSESEMACLVGFERLSSYQATYSVVAPGTDNELHEAAQGLLRKRLPIVAV
jgi:hypothetical protein